MPNPYQPIAVRRVIGFTDDEIIQQIAEETEPSDAERAADLREIAQECRSMVFYCHDMPDIMLEFSQIAAECQLEAEKIKRGKSNG